MTQEKELEKNMKIRQVGHDSYVIYASGDEVKWIDTLSEENKRLKKKVTPNNIKPALVKLRNVLDVLISKL